MKNLIRIRKNKCESTRKNENEKKNISKDFEREEKQKRKCEKYNSNRKIKRKKRILKEQKN